MSSLAIPEHWRVCGPAMPDGVDGFLSAVAARTPAPGGGAAAGVTCALAAALAAMAARFAGADPDAERADGLRAQALALADADAAAFAPVLAILREPAGAPGRADRLRAAQAGA